MACLTNGAFVAIVFKITYSVCVGIKFPPATIVPSLCSLFVVERFSSDRETVTVQVYTVTPN